MINYWVKRSIYVQINQSRIPCNISVSGENAKSTGNFVPSAKEKHYLYFFDCEKCGSEFSLNEMVKRISST